QTHKRSSRRRRTARVNAERRTTAHLVTDGRQSALRAALRLEKPAVQPAGQLALTGVRKLVLVFQELVETAHELHRIGLDGGSFEHDEARTERPGPAPFGLGIGPLQPA